MHRSAVILIPLKDLRRMESYRPRGYYADVVSRGEIVGNDLQLTKEAHADLVKKYQAPQPESEWPAIVRWVARRRSDSDRGAGDTLARLIPAGDKFKAWYKRIFGRDCGCSDRQNALNTRFPYKRVDGGE